MCGRYTITKKKSNIEEVLDSVFKDEYIKNYNAAPTNKLPVITNQNLNEIKLLQWGLIPHWAKDPTMGGKLINARLETLMEKITFKNLVQTSRCLVIADGYYEWKKEEQQKVPYYFTKEDSSLMLFAAIHQNNQFCIITRKAESGSEIHQREPLIIPKSQIANYLNVKKEALSVLNSIKPPKLKFHQISKDVNNPMNNDPRLIKAI